MCVETSQITVTINKSANDGFMINGCLKLSSSNSQALGKGQGAGSLLLVYRPSQPSHACSSAVRVQVLRALFSVSITLPKLGSCTDPMESPCPRPSPLTCGSLVPWPPPGPPPLASPNPFKQGSLLPPAGPLGSAPQTRRRRGARREAPPPPHCTCPAEVRARNFAEPLHPVSARLSLLFPLPGERTSRGASPESQTAESETSRGEPGRRPALPTLSPSLLFCSQRQAERGAEL